MLESLGWLIVRRRTGILVLTALGIVVAIPLFITVNDRLAFDAFTDPSSEAYAGEQVLTERFGVGVPNYALLISAVDGSVGDPSVAEAAAVLSQRLRDDAGVTDVHSWWEDGHPPELVSAGGDRALIVARILGDDDQVDTWIRHHSDEVIEMAGALITARPSGSAQFFRDLTEVSLEDFERAELVTIPVILVALLVVFGSVVAALLPLGVAIIAVLGTVVFLALLLVFTEVSQFALTLTSALGLGLGVDYSLFVVNRFREELSAGHDPDHAIVRTVQTAGRTVLFSALAVVVSLFALVLVPLEFMRTLGLAAMATAGMAMVGSLVILPALLARIGTGVNRGVVWRGSTRPSTGDGRWFQVAQKVMAHPVAVAGALIVVLLVVAAPSAGIDLGLPDDRTFSSSADIRVTGDILRDEFDTRASTPLFVVLPDVDATEAADDVDALAIRIASLPDVEGVTTASGAYGPDGRTELPADAAVAFSDGEATYLVVRNSVDPISGESERLVDALRSVESPFDEILVTGEAANAVDVKRKMLSGIPVGLAFIALATFVVLFLQFGSILVPLKAILLNVLSIGAMLGALVWVFQEGHGSGLLDFTATGNIYINIPILIFALAFGLSMDYEVFLLSRIKEEYDRHGDNDRAVAVGLDRCGRIVSAAAVLISLVFLTVGVFSSLRMMKAFGLGLAGVVLLDAFVIRGTLVPAVMKLAGSANWWAPGPLRRLHDRIGFSEHIELDNTVVPSSIDDAAREPVS
ncbi:MAG TPA: MMPL family transporter [Acidimicrobiales bacterium]